MTSIPEIETLTETPYVHQVAHQETVTRDDSKGIGQFFTPPRVATFMASLPTLRKNSVLLIDPGAGTGILSVSLARRICRCATPKRLHVIAFETDKRLVRSLEEAYNQCRRILSEAGHQFSFEIRTDDFLAQATKQPSLLSPVRQITKADLVIMNPPYFKIPRESVYAKDFEGILHGQPNIYALFLAAATDLLQDKGELVAITPRSFCDGPYFAAFRRWMFSTIALLHVHSFESRKEVFTAGSVLQESVITHWRKSSQQAHIRLTSSFGPEGSSRNSVSSVPTSIILKETNGDTIIRIPSAPRDTAIIGFLESLPETFGSLGFKVSTGPVVSFRATQFLRADSDGNGTVPLLSVHNVRAFRTDLSARKSGKPAGFAVVPESLKLLLPPRNYVLMRRFTSKEEKRRLVASPYFRSDSMGGYVALENHLNYITHHDRDLTEAECMGLCAILNSRLFDRYFRTISGNTQVNATELRRLHLPALATIKKLGMRMRALTFSEDNLDDFVSSAFALPAPLLAELQRGIM